MHAAPRVERQLPVALRVGVAVLGLLAASCSSAGSQRTIGLAQVTRDLSAAPRAFASDVSAVFYDDRLYPPLAALGALAIVGESFEDEERRMLDNFHPFSLNTSDQLETLGDGATLLAGSLGLALVGALADSEREYEAGKLATESLLVTGATTLVLKLVVPDQRPNGRTGDFPSGHSSMAMAAATALHRAYGVRVGVPAYLLAGAIGLQRLDSFHHDIPAVLFGWALGYLTANSIADRRASLHDSGAATYSFEPVIDFDLGMVGFGVRWQF